MKNLDIKQYCDKCGKEPEMIKEKSNKNWSAYPTKCDCGGRFKIKMSDQKGNK